jgi:hypothetical protein
MAGNHRKTFVGHVFGKMDAVGSDKAEQPLEQLIDKLFPELHPYRG